MPLINASQLLCNKEGLLGSVMFLKLVVETRHCHRASSSLAKVCIAGFHAFRDNLH